MHLQISIRLSTEVMGKVSLTVKYILIQGVGSLGSPAKPVVVQQAPPQLQLPGQLLTQQVYIFI